jgi:hypothetical protein
MFLPPQKIIPQKELNFPQSEDDGFGSYDLQDLQSVLLE